MADTSVVHPYANENDHGSAITIAAAFCMSIMLLAFATRLWVRSPLAVLFSYDDWTTAAATFVAVAQSCLTMVAVRYGLGSRIDNGTPRSQDILGMTYAGSILYILALCLGKLAIALLVLRLGHSKQHKQMIGGLSAAIIAWGLASIIAVAIPFGVTERQNDTSMSIVRWSAIEGVGLLFEVVVLCCITATVWGLRASYDTKAAVLVGFYFRIALFAIVPVRIYFISQARVDALTSTTFAATLPEVFTQLEMHANIIAATIPCLRIFLNHFYSGYLGGLGLDAPDLYFSRSGTNQATKGSVLETHKSNSRVSAYRTDITVTTSVELQIVERDNSQPWNQGDARLGPHVQKEVFSDVASDNSMLPLHPGTTTTVTGLR